MDAGRTNPIADLIAELADAGILFVVCGGVACVLHGIERLTMDIDLALDLHEANLAPFIGLMDKLGMQPRVPVDPAGLLDADTRERWFKEKNALVFTFIDPDFPTRQLDVFLREPVPYAELAGRAKRMNIKGRWISVASIDDLLAMKRIVQPPRKKDIDDIEALEKIRGRQC